MPSTEKKRRSQNFSHNDESESLKGLRKSHPKRRHPEAVVGGVVKERGGDERRREACVGKGEAQHCHMHARLRNTKTNTGWFFNWSPPKKLKYIKPTLGGVSTLT